MAFDRRVRRTVFLVLLVGAIWVGAGLSVVPQGDVILPRLAYVPVLLAALWFGPWVAGATGALLGYVLHNVSHDVPAQFHSFIELISTHYHVGLFVDGLIDTRQFVYYGSFAILLLTITYHVLEFRKWKV